MFVRAYLRASTQEQDATRSQAELEEFAAERGLTIAATYVENMSGATLNRPELFRLLTDCRPGDILLVEQIDRLSRLDILGWTLLRRKIAEKQVRVVALDLPTSWQLVTASSDEFSRRMSDAINGMMLDMLAAIARKDYEDRRRRQEQGIATAKANGAYKGRPENTERNDAITKMLAAGQSWNTIVQATGCSRSTLSRLTKRLKAEAKET